MSIAEKSTIISANNVTITENEQKVYKAGQLKTLQDSEYMNAKVSGTAISVNDVSPIEHNVGVQLKSKNLLNVKDRTVITYDGSGLNFVENAIYLNMARNGVYSYTKTTYDISNPQQLKFKTYSHAFGLNFSFKAKANETYTLSCSNFDNTQHRMGVGFFTKDCALISHLPIGEYPYTTVPVTFTTPANCYWMLVIVASSTGGVGKELTFENVQLELGTTATEYTPYVEELGGIEVSRYGKNLFDVNLDPHSIHYDVRLVSLNDGELTIKQNATTQYASYNIAIPNANNLVGKAITISCDCKVGEGGNNTSVRVLWLDANGHASAGTDILYKPYVSSNEYQHISVSGVVNAQPDESHDTLALMFYSNVSGTLSDGEYYSYFKNIQIELGTTATAYEPYTEPTTYQSTADGTVDGIKSISPNMTLLTNNNNVVINANYLRDIDTYIDNLKTDVALTGGE